MSVDVIGRLASSLFARAWPRTIRKRMSYQVWLLKCCLLCLRSGLAPEIAHFRIPSDKLDVVQGVPSDWYIKGARCGTVFYQ